MGERRKKPCPFNFLQKRPSAESRERELHREERGRRSTLRMRKKKAADSLDRKGKKGKGGRHLMVGQKGKASRGRKKRKGKSSAPRKEKRISSLIQSHGGGRLFLLSSFTRSSEDVR